MQVVRLLKTKRQLTLQSQFNQFPNEVQMSFINTPTTVVSAESYQVCWISYHYGLTLPWVIEQLW